MLHVSDVSHKTRLLQSISQNRTVREIQAIGKFCKEHFKMWYNKNTRAVKILSVIEVMKGKRSHTGERGQRSFQL